MILIGPNKVPLMMGIDSSLILRAFYIWLQFSRKKLLIRKRTKIFIPVHPRLPNLIEKWQEDLISIAFDIFSFMTVMIDTFANLLRFEWKSAEPLSDTITTDCSLNHINHFYLQMKVVYHD